MIVLTCRPDDYLEADDLPGEGSARSSRAGGLIAAANLLQLIRRGGAAVVDAAG